MGKLVVEHLVKQFEDVTAVDHVSFSVEDGELLTVVGPSGCGKTTLLRMLAGFAEPTHGMISLDGTVLFDSDKNIKAVPPEGRDIGMVFQTYAVWPHMNVYNNVAYPLKIRKLGRKLIKEKVTEILKLVHLDGYEKRMAFEMSGGQQQRVALARALVMEPRLLLLDEPFSNLDAVLRETMQREVKEIQRKLGITVINVTHDQSEAMAMSDKIALMRDGVLIQFDTPRNIYEKPVNTFAASFIGAANILPVAELPLSKEGESGYIAFRQQDVIYDPTSVLAAKVKGSEYLGNGIRYRLETEGGHDIKMIAPSSMNFEIGEMVPISIRNDVRLGT